MKFIVLSHMPYTMLKKILERVYMDNIIDMEGLFNKPFSISFPVTWLNLFFLTSEDEHNINKKLPFSPIILVLLLLHLIILDNLWYKAHYLLMLRTEYTTSRNISWEILSTWSPLKIHYSMIFNLLLMYRIYKWINYKILMGIFFSFC